MAWLLKDALEQVGQLHKADDDLIDRLNHRVTVILLVTFAAFVSGKQFVGNPISCWTPTHFSDPQLAYTNSICWLKGTYYLEEDRRLIPHRTQNSEFRIAYYQFVPYILLLMAMLFYLPHMFWRNMSRNTGFDLRCIIQRVKKITISTQMADIDHVALEIHVALKYNTSERCGHLNRLLSVFSCSRQHRNQLSLVYLITKFLYTSNILCQFYLLTTFLGFSFYTFGVEWFKAMFYRNRNRANNEAHDFKWFPRVVMCDFMVRHLGSNQHWMAIQCNLPINLFNELIFLILWAWLILLCVLTCLSFVICLVSLYTDVGRWFISKYLHMHSPKLDETQQANFVKNYLRWDGLLVLRLVALNTNDIIMSNLVVALFKIYSNSSKKQNDDSHGQLLLLSNGH